MEKYLNRSVIDKAFFNVEGTFESMYAAHSWFREKGYDDGSTCVGMPCAIMKGSYMDYDLPLKWKNMTKEERDSVHGVMVGNMREGPVTVYLFV